MSKTTVMTAEVTSKAGGVPIYKLTDGNGCLFYSFRGVLARCTTRKGREVSVEVPSRCRVLHQAARDAINALCYTTGCAA